MDNTDDQLVERESGGPLTCDVLDSPPWKKGRAVKHHLSRRESLLRCAAAGTADHQSLYVRLNVMSGAYGRTESIRNTHGIDRSR